jgi:hypothetical protein
MEQKKFDPNSIIGFVLIFGILLGCIKPTRSCSDEDGSGS